MASFAEALKVDPIDSHAYRVHLKLEWCIGSGTPQTGRRPHSPDADHHTTVPHGGVVTSVLQSVAKQHFLTTLRAQNQPDCITLHADFVQRTSAGLAIVTVKDVKLGRQTSTVQVTLTQDGRNEVIAVLTHANLALESGISLPTSWSLDPAPPPADLEKLAAHGTDGTWTVFTPGGPNPNFRKAALQVDIYNYKGSRVQRGMMDQWIKFKSGEPFTNTCLGLLSDMFPQMVESYKGDQEALEGAGVSERQLSTHWYPTLALNVDVKRSLPKEGAKWMFVRIQSKMIHNGRKDLEVIIMDEHGEIIALSHHVAMILSASRNLAKRGEGRKDGVDGSKL
jgi:acyl-coenzyme A thioesterase PaaI-like protein